MKRLALTLTLIFATTLVLYGQQQQRQMEVYFEQDVSILDRDNPHNKRAFKELSDLLKDIESDSLKTITNIYLDSYTSPEGGVHYNAKLSERRAASIHNYLSEVEQMPDSLMESRANGIDWDKLAQMVQESDMQEKDKEQVIWIINNVEEETWRRVNPNDRWQTLVDSRHKHLMDLNGGKPYWYMYRNIFPYLRASNVVSVYYIVTPMIGSEVTMETSEPIYDLQIPTTYTEPIEEYIYKPLLAVKSNLLYDVLTVLNVELEVPIGQRWSIAGEHTFPWWTWDNEDESSSRNRIQYLTDNLEVKYWFGDRTDKAQLTGWYAGLYGNLGKYDFERSGEGYQGEFWGAGLTGGYAHTINKKGNLRLEYSLSLGYANSDYRDYEAFFGADDMWHPIRLSTNNTDWFGPTRARVSLEWMLFRKVKKGGNQ